MGAVENIITYNLPIWSSAIQSKSSAGRGTSNKRNLYGVKKLRELILDLAVRGLLVPQDPSDEPASVLLEKIAAEKERLVNEGKIKKQKPLLKVSDEEKLDLISVVMPLLYGFNNLERIIYRFELFYLCFVYFICFKLF